MWILPLEKSDSEHPVLFWTVAAKALGQESWSVCPSRVRQTELRSTWAMLPVCILVQVSMDMQETGPKSGTWGPSYQMTNP